jgi:hypothetical protein
MAIIAWVFRLETHTLDFVLFRNDKYNILHFEAQVIQVLSKSAFAANYKMMQVYLSKKIHSSQY